MPFRLDLVLDSPASLNPIAIAWARDLTLGPFLEPLWSEPALNSCITFETLPGRDFI